MKRAAPVLMALAALLALLVLGGPTAARLAFLAGAPEVTLALTDDPGARGAALYEAGRFTQADAVFAGIGRGATYNRAATLAVTGDPALSVAYYDAVLFADRWDAEARRNRDVVATLVQPVIGEAMGHGRIERLLVEDGVAVAGFDAENPTAPTVVPDQILRRPTDARALGADRAWLETLADAPGEYLARRLAAEYDRRVEQGLAAPPEPSPW